MATIVTDKKRGKWFIRFKGIDKKWKQKYHGRIQGWKDPITGKIVKNGLLKKEIEIIRKEYDSRELNRMHDRVIQEVDISPERALDDFVEQSLSRGSKVNKLAEGSIRAYDTQILCIKNWFEKIGLKKLSKLTIQEVDNFTHDLNYLAPKTLKGRQQLLINFLKWSAENGYWDKSRELNRIKKMKKVKPTVRFLSTENLQKLFDAMPQKYQNATKFMYYVGARVGEVGFFRWQDYNSETGQLTFTVNEGTKKKVETTIFICKKAQAIIEEQRKINSDSMYIFSNFRGSRLSARNLYESMKRRFKKLNIEASSHILRHTFASHLATAGVGLIKLKKLMRHEDIRDTMIYAHLMNDGEKEAVEMLPI